MSLWHAGSFDTGTEEEAESFGKRRESRGVNFGSNLLAETKQGIKENGKNLKDVLWVGSANGKYAMTWKQFVKVADINYDCGYGSEEVSLDLVVVGEDWWLERHEYDGAEWWEFKTLPVKSLRAEELGSKGIMRGYSGISRD